MANNLNAYNEIFYAQEALRVLYKSLGMAGRVMRTYDPTPRANGDTIQVRRPSSFAVSDAPSAAQDLTPEKISITLNNWKEVKFVLTDKDLSLTNERLIGDHIAPAAYALADKIDTDLCALYKKIPWVVGTAGTTPSAVADITNSRAQMRKNKVPLNDRSNIHFMVDPDAENKFLQLTAFTQWQGSGNEGVSAQMAGDIGQRFGFNFFANQNVITHTAGTCSTTALAINNGAGYSKGATSINLDAGTVTGTLVAGDILSIAGDAQKYAVTGTVTASGNQLNSVGIFPALAQNVADNAVVTATLTNGVRNLAFHKDFAILAFAPLSDMANELGAKVATAFDPVSQLALRSRMYYVGNSSEVHVALDVLYGYDAVNANLGVQLLG